MTAAGHASARHARATRVVFLVSGIGMATWAPLVPYAKARLGLDEAVLGLVLLGLGIGSLIAMPFAGIACARYGSRRVMGCAVAGLALALPALAVADHAATLAASLVLFGASLASLDVAMNLQAIVVERESGRPLMSGFHGLFSVGGIVGAAGVALALETGATPLAVTVAVAFGLVLATFAVRHALITTRVPRGGPTFAWPHGIVLLIGALAFACFLMEGAVLDWSGVFLTTVRDVPVARAGIGYVAFSIAMTLGRLTGDRVVARFGPLRVIVIGGLVAAIGALMVATVPAWPMTVAGFALVGIGCANIVPILFTAAGRQTVMPEALAVPAMTTLGYAGLLAGPAAIGFVAHATSLPATFAMLAVLMLLVAVAGRRLPTR